LILDQEISEIMVNRSGRIFIERRAISGGSRCSSYGKELQVAVRNIARALGDDIGEQQPYSTPASRMDRALPP